MAKRKIPRPEPPDARAFTVVLEEIRAANRGFGEGQQLLTEQMQQLRGDVQVIRGDVQQLRGEMSSGFEEVNRRLLRVEHEMGETKNDVRLVKIAVLDHARELKEIRVELQKKVDRDEVEQLVARGR